jgi:hypothetical protein
MASGISASWYAQTRAVRVGVAGRLRGAGECTAPSALGTCRGLGRRHGPWRTPCERGRPCLVALSAQSAATAFFWLRSFLNLPGRNPHDVDGVADDMGGAAGTCWRLGHGVSVASWNRKSGHNLPRGSPRPSGLMVAAILVRRLLGLPTPGLCMYRGGCLCLSDLDRASPAPQTVTVPETIHVDRRLASGNVHPLAFYYPASLTLPGGSRRTSIPRTIP